MPYFLFNGIEIAGISSAVPTQKHFVKDYGSKFGEKLISNFTKSTGVESFYKTFDGQTASDLGYVAAKDLIERQSINTNEIGALVFISHSTDYRRPATSFVLHKRLGLSKECIAFDVNLGCSAFVKGISIVCSLMSNSDINNALLICAETVTKLTNPQDGSTAMLFGDGGSAAIFKKDENAKEIRVLANSDGNGFDSIIAPAGGFRNMQPTASDEICEDGYTRNLYNICMNGGEVFQFTLTDVPKQIKRFLDYFSASIESYDYHVLHQANQFIIKQLSRKLGIPKDKILYSIQEYGNTSAASLPITLSHNLDKFSNNKSMKILFSGFGVGLSWAVADAYINSSNIYPVIKTDEYYPEGIYNSVKNLGL